MKKAFSNWIQRSDRDPLAKSSISHTGARIEPDAHVVAHPQFPRYGGIPSSWAAALFTTFMAVLSQRSFSWVRTAILPSSMAWATADSNPKLAAADGPPFAASIHSR